MVKDLKVFVVGMGSIGQRHLDILKQLEVKNISVTDPSKQQIECVKKKYADIRVCDSFEQGLMEKPDAVFIMTPPKLHIPMALKAAEHHCHVFCEKPLSDSFEQVNQLKEMVAAQNIRFAVGLCFRYHRGIKRLKEIIDSNKIGRIVSITAFMGEHFPTVRPDYKTLFSAKYGGALDLMHDLDLALWLANSPVRNCVGICGNSSDIQIEAPDVANMIIEFENETMATVHLDFYHQPRKRVLECACTGGSVQLEFSAWDHCRLECYDAKNRETEIVEMETQRNDMFFDEDQAFLESINGTKTDIYGIEDGLLSMKAISNIRRNGEKKDE